MCCHQKEKLSISAKAQRFSSCKKNFIKFYSLQFIYAIKRKSLKPQTRTRNITPAEDKILCNASKRNSFLFSCGIKAKTLRNTTSERSATAMSYFNVTTSHRTLSHCALRIGKIMCQTYAP